MILTTAIFFSIAPTPDSHDIAEFTADFISYTSAAEFTYFRNGD